VPPSGKRIEKDRRALAGEQLEGKGGEWNDDPQEHEPTSERSH
jgi:hypothetical protein